MKALKPEIDKLKEKHGDDKQAFGLEQMKLWKSAGVNLGWLLTCVAPDSYILCRYIISFNQIFH